MNKRDKVLLTVLPAALLFLLYGFFFSKSSINELKELERQADVLESRVPSQAKVASTQRKLFGLRREVQQLRRQQSSDTSIASSATPSAERAIEADAFFESLLEDYQVILMSEALAESNDTRAYSRIIKNSPGTTLWNIELAGNYPNLAGLLAALGETQLPLTPVAVEMDASLQGQSDLRRWNLWIYR